MWYFNLVLGLSVILSSTGCAGGNVRREWISEVGLIKRDNDGLHYWWALKHDDHLDILQGPVGKLVEGRQIPVPDSMPFQDFIRQQRDRQIARGYVEIRSNVVVRYEIGNFVTVAMFKKCQSLSAKLADHLWELGLGRWARVEFGPDTVDVYSWSLDAKAAVAATLQVLEREDALAGAVVAFGQNEDYEVAWPQDHTGAFEVSDSLVSPIIKIRASYEESLEFCTIPRGTYADGKQFLGYWHDFGGKEYALLHTFDAEGNLLDTAEYREAEDENFESEDVDQLLQMISALEQPRPGEVYLRLFKVTIEGETTGLIDTSDSESFPEEVTLEPFNMFFIPPWDGGWDS